MVNTEKAATVNTERAATQGRPYGTMCTIYQTGNAVGADLRVCPIVPACLHYCPCVSALLFLRVCLLFLFMNIFHAEIGQIHSFRKGRPHRFTPAFANPSTRNYRLNLKTLPGKPDIGVGLLSG